MSPDAKNGVVVPSFRRACSFKGGEASRPGGGAPTYRPLGVDPRPEVEPVSRRVEGYSPDRGGDPTYHPAGQDSKPPRDSASRRPDSPRDRGGDPPTGSECKRYGYLHYEAPRVSIARSVMDQRIDHQMWTADIREPTTQAVKWAVVTVSAH